jgi:replicative DNA helicase
MQVETDRLWSRANEAAVLGSMIVGPKCIPAILERLSVEDFFDPAHKDIFEAIVKAWRHHPSGDIDGLLVRNLLEHSEAVREAGGWDYYRERIVESVPSSANALYYAKHVRDHSRFRQLVAKAEEIESVVNELGTVAEQTQRVQDIALSLDVTEDRPTHFAFADHATDRAVKMFDASNVIPTGYQNIDNIIPGFKDGQLIVPAGRPGSGKSSLAEGMALRMGKAGRSVVFFSLEMSHKEFIDRACAIWGHVNVQLAQRHGIDPMFQSERDKVYAAAQEIAKLNIVVAEGADTVEKQLAFIRSWKQRCGVDVVFIDYLQLMSLGRRGESRLQEITEISRKLKLLAMREEIPVVALSQLNRACESRENHRPRLSDLRESGSIEQDADVVMLLHREDYYRRQADPNAAVDGLADVTIAKNRSGPTGTAKLTFLDACCSFEDLSSDE